VQLFVYRIVDRQVIATITGFTEQACERVAAKYYRDDHLGWTYSREWSVHGELRWERKDIRQLSAVPIGDLIPGTST
jgi:hypothetical protein